MILMVNKKIVFIMMMHLDRNKTKIKTSKIGAIIKNTEIMILIMILILINKTNSFKKNLKSLKRNIKL